MIIKDANIIYYDRIEEGSILVKSGKIIAINPIGLEDECIINGKGLYLSPGFIDIHIHGAGGFDVMDGTDEAINTIAKTIAKHGTTSFLPTTMTCAINHIKKTVSAISKAKEKGTQGAAILGIHLEGPFISPKMIGAQNPKYIEAPSIEGFNEIVGPNIDDITSVTIAPEIEGAKELTKYLVNKGIVVSIGHSKATYAQVLEGIEYGISHSTHLFNAMTGFHHREPGVVGAIFDTDITTEAICDGIHIAYPSLRVALKQKSLDRIILVTDAMMACCIAEGNYSLGEQIVKVEHGAARLENGALAGSVLTLDKAIRNVNKNTNYELYEIIRMVTYNPAKHCGVQNKKGLIKEGYDADLVLFDKDINIKKVIIGGIEV